MTWPPVLRLIFLCVLFSISHAGYANSFRVLDEDRDALQARIDLIQRATSTIDIAYYAIDTDEVPVAILELLRQASNRGVRVRILADGLKSRLPSDFEDYLRTTGIQIRVFHPLHIGRPRWLNRRLHSKLIVVDSSIAIVGSRNLENEHFGFSSEKNFVDCDALVSGDVASHVKRYFQWLWDSPHVLRAATKDSMGFDVLNYRPYGRSEWHREWRQADSQSDYQRLLDRSVDRVTHHFGVTLNSNSDWLGDSLHHVEIDLLHDIDVEKTHRHVQKTFVRLIDHAQRRILIESPYPAFDHEVRRAIGRARSRGVCVTILTNSLDSTDQTNVYAAYQNHKRGLIRQGVHLREYCGGDTLHAKSMVIDESTWMIGSYNFDARSDNVNLELCLVSDDERAAALLLESIHRRMAKSTLVSGSRLVLDVGDESTAMKRTKMALKRTYIELIRRFL